MENQGGIGPFIVLGIGMETITPREINYIMDQGKTGQGRKCAETLEIKELPKEDIGVEKYRKSENKIMPGWA